MVKSDRPLDAGEVIRQARDAAWSAKAEANQENLADKLRGTAQTARELKAMWKLAVASWSPVGLLGVNPDELEQMAAELDGETGEEPRQVITEQSDDYQQKYNEVLAMLSPEQKRCWDQYFPIRNSQPFASCSDIMKQVKEDWPDSDNDGKCPFNQGSFFKNVNRAKAAFKAAGVPVP